MILVVFGLIISLGGISGAHFRWGNRHETTTWLLALTAGTVVLQVILRRLLEAGWLEGEGGRRQVNRQALKISALGFVTGFCLAAGLVLLVYLDSGVGVIALALGVAFAWVLWSVASNEPGEGAAASRPRYAVIEVRVTTEADAEVVKTKLEELATTTDGVTLVPSR